MPAKAILAHSKSNRWIRSRLVVKDLRNDPSIPSMHEMQQANFPFRMLDEKVIAPRSTLPQPDDHSISPVLLLQANFITGGLLLTVVGHHSATDMIGQGQIIHLLSKACHNEPFTLEELSSGKLAGRNLIPLLDESYRPGPELYNQIMKPLSTTEGTPPPLPPSSWAYFSFSLESLATLKCLASKTLTSGIVSTDDALSAFIWQSVTRARLPRLGPSSSSTFGRAVNIRRFHGVPKTYTGLIQNMVYETSTLEKLIDAPLGTVASRLRAAVHPDTSKLEYNSRALITAIARSSDKAPFFFAAKINPGADIMISPGYL